ncbi:MAG TPA: biotin/lipoate A/B protein ligase family protein [Abditibacterium sp.]
MKTPRALGALDLSFDAPAENLAADEALLEAAEAGEIGPTLRFWESPSHFVALGYTNRAALEANLPLCAAQNVPILRRASGGGTVLQGPGCLNYALIHPIEAGQALNVGATNGFVMERQRAAFAAATNESVELAGQTDLAIAGRKFSGNAQKRKARFFLFHGTILLDFDLELVQHLLLPPPKQPDYRAQRSHLEFIRNLEISRDEAKTALRRAWNAEVEVKFESQNRMEQLIAEKYERDEWNFKF